MKIDPLRHARAELTAAHNAKSRMAVAKTMDDFEADWRLFLNHIEKFWVKIERTCQPMKNAFQPWQGKFVTLRKQDMLLRYLKEARDVDNHSIQDVATLTPSQAGFRFANPTGGFIKSMTITNGQVSHYEGDPMVVDFIPPQPIVIPIISSGVTFLPPTEHLGKPISTQHPHELAELGYSFYSDFFREVAAKFFPER